MAALEFNLRERTITYYNAAFLVDLEALEEKLCEDANFLVKDLQ
jgi:hypothetical protein